MNESIKKHLKNLLLTLGVMSGAFIVSLVLQELLEIKEHITTVFVFGVFIISLLSDGYFWGILAAFISMMAVNFAFAFPYFSFTRTKSATNPVCWYAIFWTKPKPVPKKKPTVC